MVAEEGEEFTALRERRSGQAKLAEVAWRTSRREETE
jgi:hypothetical protein